MPKLTSNVYVVEDKKVYLKGEEAPKGYKGKNVVKSKEKKEPKE